MPMKRNFHAFHVILDIDNNTIVFADLDTWPGDHSIGGQDTAFNTVSQHALAMTPNGIRSIWGANLTSAVNGKDEDIKW